MWEFVRAGDKGGEVSGDDARAYCPRHAKQQATAGQHARDGEENAKAKKDTHDAAEEDHF
jgi:hypothetical protein